jgi:RHS repeat-associated protein
MEKDEEVKGAGNFYDFGARIYDSRLGRWLSLDPLMVLFQYESNYCFVSNSTIIYVDMGGLAKYRTNVEIELDKDGNEISRSTLIVFINDQDLIIKEIEVSTSIMGKSTHDTKKNWEFYDVNEVHTTVKKANGEKKTTITEVKGDKRYTSNIKSKGWARTWMKSSKDEINNSKFGLTGIRWTTSQKGTAGQGNSLESGKGFIRSENLDALLGVLDFTKGVASGSQKNLIKPIRSLKDFLNKVSMGNDVVDFTESAIDLVEKISKLPNYDKNGHTCASCPRERHDNLNYIDMDGNVMNGDTGDTLRKSNTKKEE